MTCESRGHRCEAFSPPQPPYHPKGGRIDNLRDYTEIIDLGGLDGSRGRPDRKNDDSWDLENTFS